MKQGERGGVTHSKGTQAGSQTQVHCRALAHGTCALPTVGSKFPLKTQGYPLRRLFGWLCCQHGLSGVDEHIDRGLTLFFRRKS